MVNLVRILPDGWRLESFAGALVEIDADRIRRRAILEHRRGREGRCVAHGCECELIEPGTAARLLTRTNRSAPAGPMANVTIVLPRWPASGLLRASADQILAL
jgi:hypothetical protein